MSLNVKKIRKDFPVFKIKVNGKPLVYLDNAATTLKPLPVINAVSDYYTNYTSNVHRGIHHLSEKATNRYEKSREVVKKFLNASLTSEIIFTKGTTESINLVAQSYGRTFLKKGDEILISAMEHHSNIVPWQILCELNGCALKVIPINGRGEIILEEFERLISNRTKFVSLVLVSNSLGSVNPIKQMIKRAHQNQIPVLIDAAQAAGHQNIDVQDLDCDFLAFSGHKVFGPTGVGILYAKTVYLNRMPPYQAGGDMISSVNFIKSSYNVLPYKFEAGTPHIAGVIGLGAALEYLQSIGWAEIKNHETQLLDYATRSLTKNISHLRIIGTAKHKISILSFVLPKIHPHDLGTLVDEEGVAIRTGHHCTQPVMKFFEIPATSRASLSFYNTFEDIDVLVRAINNAKKLFP